MADFVNVNGYFSRIWPDAGRYRGYFVTGMKEYYVMGFVDSETPVPAEKQKMSLELKLARNRETNEPVMAVGGQKRLYYVEHVGPDLSRRDGLFRYLTSAIFDGVGDVTANRLLDLYGPDVLNVIQDDPARLEADGFTRRIIDILDEGINNPDIANCIMRWLPDMTQACSRIIGDYYTAGGMIPERFQKRLSRNPYQVYMDVMEGCALSARQLKSVFMAVDRYALSSGWLDGDRRRINAAIDVAIKNLSTSSGSTYLDVTNPGIYADIRNECASCLIHGDIEASLNGVDCQIGDRYSHCGNERMLYTQHMLRAEQGCASIIKKLIAAPPVYPISDAELDNLLNQYRTREGYELDEDQKLAVRTSMKTRFTVITGGPGTGKTTVLDAIVWTWQQVMAINADIIPVSDPKFCGVDRRTGSLRHWPLNPRQIFLMAPTGKAAQRMNEKIRSRNTADNATTIAMRLVISKKDNDPERCIPTYYKNKLAIVDETSMVSMSDAAGILRLMRDCQLVFVGDPDQLLPVGAGQFLADVISSLERICPSSLVRLRGEHRLGKQSTLNLNAGIIRNGGIFENGSLTPYMPAQSPGEYDVIDRDSDGFPLTDEQVKNYAVEEYVRRFRQYDPRDICLITPMHPPASPVCSDRILNILIQRIVNPEKFLDPVNSCTATIYAGDIEYTGRLYGLHPEDPVNWDDPRLKAAWGTVINEAPYYEYPVGSGKTDKGQVAQLHIGDRVMATKNNYAADMFNGDTGTIVGYLITPNARTDNLLIIVPDTPRVSGVEYCCVRSGRFSEIELGYCLSVHKTQGSEYDHVILALPEILQYRSIGNRSTLYTAETRAKKDVTVIGRPETVWSCISRQPPVRQTKLAQRLAGPDGCITDPDLSVF